MKPIARALPPCRSGAPAAKAFAHPDAIRGEAPLQQQLIIWSYN